VCRSGEQLTVILTDLVALGELMTLNRLRLADV